MFKKKLILIPALLFALTSCGGDDPTTGSTTTATDQTTVTGTTDQTTSKDDTTSQTVEVESVTIKNKDHIKSVCDEGWYVGSAAIELDVEILPAGSLDPFFAEYTTSNPAVASVSSGTVVAIGKGTATITVSAGDFSDSVEVTVTETVNATVAELRALDSNTVKGVVYSVDGVIVANTNNGPVIEDETGYIFAYSNTSLEVGTYVDVRCGLGAYNNVNQLTGCVYTERSDSPTFTLSTVEEWEAADLEAYKAGDEAYFSIVCDVTVDGKYYNATVQGASKTLSLYGPTMKVEAGWNKLTGYMLYVSGGKYYNVAVVSAEPTEAPEEPQPTVGTIAEITEAAPNTTVETKGVVIAKTQRSYLIDDNTGKILVFDKNMPDFNINDYITVSGKLDYYNNQPQIASPTVAACSETAPSLSNVITTWTATELDAYDFTTNDYVEIAGTFELDGDYPILKVAGAKKDVRASYPITSLGLDSSKVGRTLTFKGFMIGGSGTRAHMIVNEVSVKAYDAVTSVDIAEPTSTEVYVGGSLQLKATVLPATADPAITWETSDDTTATVSTTGLVTGVKEGNVTITAKSTADETKLDTIELSVVEPEGTLVEKVLAEYDFGGLTGTGTKLDSNSGLTAFNNSYVAASSLSNSLVSVNLTNVYSGNGTGGLHPTTEGLLKTGTGDYNGVIELTLSEDASVTKVEVVAQPWNEKTGDTISVNDGEAKTLPVEADTVTSFEGNFGNVVKIETEKRAFIFNIKLYVKVIETGEDVPVESVTLNHTELSMVTGETVTLVASVSPITATDKTVVWESNNPEVATVEDGVVTAVAAGNATITATAGGKSATCSVVVSDATTSTIAEVKELAKGDVAVTVGKVIAIDGNSAYISDETGGLYVYNWFYNDKNSELRSWTMGQTVEVRGVIDIFNGLFQIKYDETKDSYIKAAETEATAMTPITLTEEGYAALEETDCGNLYTFEAKFKSGTVTSGKAQNLVFTLGSTDITLRTSKYAEAPDIELVVGSTYSITAPLNWYNNPQFAYIVTGTTITLVA